MGTWSARQSSRRWLWVSLLLVGSVLAGIGSRPRTIGPASPPSDVIASIGQPVQSLLARLSGGLKNSWQFVTHVFELEQENGRLRKQLEQVQAAHDEVAELRQEVGRLKETLALRDEVGGKTVGARTIGRGPSPWFQTLILDVGRRDGVQPGSVVLAPGGLVGQIYFVGYSGSKVICLTDRQGSVGARTQREAVRDVVGVCKGDGSDLCTLTYPEAGADVRPGDAVVTSGHEHGSRFPPGLLIGHVVTIDRRPHESSLVATIRPAVDMDRVEEVLVLLPLEAEGTAVGRLPDLPLGVDP